MQTSPPTLPPPHTHPTLHQPPYTHKTNAQDAPLLKTSPPRPHPSPQELERIGQLDNTYIFYTADNGYKLGHHRLVSLGQWGEGCTGGDEGSAGGGLCALFYSRHWRVVAQRHRAALWPGRSVVVEGAGKRVVALQSVRRCCMPLLGIGCVLQDL